MIIKPAISSDFTIDDIHNIREYHYEFTKSMIPQDRRDFYNEGGKKILKEMEKRKLLKRG